MKRMMGIFLVVLLPLSMLAQTYRPEGRAFVCVNGHNRYTRALYGSPTEWRVETSDRPVFALYKKNDYRNLQFRVNGVWLDKTDFCEARYEDGMRSYLLRHKAWGPKATLRVKVVASLQQEQALWRFLTTGFTGDVKLEVFVSNIRKPKLSHNGDLGADPKDAFEADGREPVQQWSQTFEDECYVYCNGIATNATDVRDASERFEEMEAAMKELADRMEFNTPDPYVNTLGGALVVAADGDWDGKTWLHGCIGWRTPLAGWRAGYLGDVLGWPERAMSHFDAYAKSQDNKVSYIDELLWHFQYDADKTYLRKMWPVLKNYLDDEKGNFAPVTRSLAYNYRANLLAARIAKLVGENGTSYQQEAETILKAMNQRLWLNDKGHWAEYQDQMGLKRVHESAAVWSIYTPIDCGACTPEQAYSATKYVDKEIPHIDVERSTFNVQTIATSNWLPYSWGINNVAAAEVMHTALAYFEAGRSEEGYRLMMANILDQMYYGQSPANFGQISKYDAACGECYRDFGDCIGISARTLLQGLFGIQPNALEGRCIIRPGFPEAWDSASVRTPYIYYKYQRQGDEAVYEVTQHFAQPQQIVIRQNLGMGKYRDVVGTSEQHQVIRVQVPVKYPEVTFAGYGITEQRNIGTDEPTFAEKFHKQNIDRVLNDSVTSISGINDSVFRSLIVKDEYIAMGVPFRTSAMGRNIAFTTLWDNYPDSISIPLSGRYQQAWLLMAGTTNHMQCHIANGIVVAQYNDGTADTLQLVNPYNWCPIERDYYVDGKAFQTAEPRPYRVAFAYDKVSRNLSKAHGLPFANPQGGEIGPRGADGGEIKGGAATMLRMPLNRQKKLQSLTIRTLSNDVVIGLMALTLQ